METVHATYSARLEATGVSVRDHIMHSYIVKSVCVLHCPVVAVSICCVVAMQGAGKCSGLRVPLNKELCFYI